jgi:hypothetical protein
MCEPIASVSAARARSGSLRPPFQVLNDIQISFADPREDVA